MDRGLPYWDYLTTEVIPTMRQLLPLSTARADNFVGGVSMGGFGAFKLAFSHPDWFSAVMAMSPVVDLTSLPQVMPDYQEIFSGPLPNQYLEKLAQEAPPAALKSLRTFYCIGDQDILKPQNARFVRRLQDQGTLTLDLKTGPGDHDWLYWQEMFPEMLRWLLNVRLSDGAPLKNQDE